MSQASSLSASPGSARVELSWVFSCLDSVAPSGVVFSKATLCTFNKNSFTKSGRDGTVIKTRAALTEGADLVCSTHMTVHEHS